MERAAGHKDDGIKAVYACDDNYAMLAGVSIASLLGRCRTDEEAEAFRRDDGVYTKEEIEAAKTHPVVVHFTSSFLSRRPWFEGSEHPYTKEWERVQAQTPWADMPKLPYRPDMERRLLNMFYRHVPRKLGLFAAALVNSYIRPLMKR